jgi:hypothetical protein
MIDGFLRFFAMYDCSTKDDLPLKGEGWGGYSIAHARNIHMTDATESSSSRSSNQPTILTDQIFVLPNLL